MTEPYALVPELLKSLPHWVCWRLETRGEKTTKLPYSLNGRLASSTDKSTWHTFEDIKHCIPTAKNGAGFCFNGNGIIGIDLDNCFVADGKINPLFRDFTELFKDTYVEYSPSGKGLHIFVKCSEQPYEKGRRKSFENGVGLEVYAEGRYFTLTGKRYGEVSTIADYDAATIRLVCDPILSPVVAPFVPAPKDTGFVLGDTDIVQLAGKAKNKDKFLRLMGGDTTGYPSSSEADAALSFILAFYTQNVSQIERIMRSSKLYRQKWDDHRDYLTGTVVVAVRNCKGKYTGEPEKKKKAKSERETPPYKLQPRGWFVRNDTLYLQTFGISDDVAEYAFAYFDGKEIKYIDSLTVKEPVMDGITVVEQGLQYVPRDLPVNRDGQVIPLVGLVRRCELESITASDIAQIKTAMYDHAKKYCDLGETDLDLCIYYALMTWFYPKLSTLPYLRFRADTGKGKSRILKVISEMCFMPVKAGGASTAAGTIRFQEIWHGSLVIDEGDLKGEADESGGYTNDMIKYLNLGFEREQFFIKADKQDPKQQEIFDPFCPKIIAMRGVFQDPATEGRCLSISPSETERTDISAILPGVYVAESAGIRALLSHYVLTNWGIITDADPYPSFQDVDCEPRLKQLGSPLARVLSKILPDGIALFKHYIERRQKEVKKDRAQSFVGVVANILYETALEQEEKGNGYVSAKMLADAVGSTSTKITKTLKDAELAVEQRRVKVTLSDGFGNPSITKSINTRVVVVPNTRIWREVCRRYIDTDGQQETLTQESVDCPSCIRSSEFIHN